MAHTLEYDCVVCGAHFDSQEELHAHDLARHSPKETIDIHAPAEPIGNEHRRSDRPPERDDDTMR